MSDVEGAVTGPEFQRSLEGLRGVRGARVEAEGSNVLAVRVLVVPERDTDQTIAEVLDLAAEEYGVEVDPQTIEILRVAEQIKSEGVRRRKLSAIATERSGERFRARVVLELGGDVLVGESDSPSERGFEIKSVARATLQGLRELLAIDTDLDSVQIISIGESRLAVVTLGRGADILVGSALVRLDEHDAIARATLDAVNRTLGGPQNRPGLMRLVR